MEMISTISNIHYNAIHFSIQDNKTFHKFTHNSLRSNVNPRQGTKNADCTQILGTENSWTAQATNVKMVCDE